jgi:uncharacterized glyoxalase superfamily protein PhnB
VRATSIYPVLMTKQVREASAFYCDWFGYEQTFSSDWYVSLRRGAWELALLDPTHPTVPEGYGRFASGVLLNMEVDDVDAEHQRLVIEGGLKEVLPLRDEDFGQRHFILEGPDGVLVDVISEIEPTAEFASHFADVAPSP